MKVELRSFLAAVILAALVVVPAPDAAAKPPVNFVFLLVDDLGWADVGVNGSGFHETPHIDKLAATGMRFTQAYAACPVCSPTRASIMTGRHPVRVDITDWIPGKRQKNPKLITPQDRDNLALEEVTIAEVLKGRGYQTFFAGKWHLGSAGHLPQDQGFDVNIGGNHTGGPRGGYYAPWSNPQLPDRGRPGEYLTDRLTDESIRFLQGREIDKPFLLYLSYYNVHTPVQACEEFVDFYKKKSARLFQGPTPFAPEHDGFSRMRQDRPDFASMVAAVDKSVGRLLAQLAALKLADETVVIFFSDNGGLSTLNGKNGSTSNHPLRAGKGWLYEGGIREPMIVRAPGVTRPGTTCDTPVLSTDFFPTMLELAGLAPMPERHRDGVSLVPLLKGRPLAGERPLAWHYPHYHGSAWTPGAAIRVGHHKLIEFYHHEKIELYDLANDPGEQEDLSRKNPGKAAELLDQLHAWQKQVGAKMTKPNPAFRASR